MKLNIQIDTIIVMNEIVYFILGQTPMGLFQKDNYYRIT